MRCIVVNHTIPNIEINSMFTLSHFYPYEFTRNKIVINLQYFFVELKIE